MEPPRPNYYCVVDVEATCVEDNTNWVHEIIELPVVVVDATSCKVVHEFRRYVRPTETPTLSPFCVNLTGIEQYMVDKANTLDNVLKELGLWLVQKKLLVPLFSSTLDDLDYTDASFWFPLPFVIATDGPWDCGKFLWSECQRKNIGMPFFLRSWLDVRQAFAEAHLLRKQNINRMLAYLGLRFEGREHSGLADSRNIARILISLIQRGLALGANSSINFLGGKTGRLEFCPPPGGRRGKGAIDRKERFTQDGQIAPAAATNTAQSKAPGNGAHLNWYQKEQLLARKKAKSANHKKKRKNNKGKGGSRK